MSGHCLDCGEMLDRFGICPFADPERARVERAPVNCGHDAAYNAAIVRAEFSMIAGRADRPAKLPNLMD